MALPAVVGKMGCFGAANGWLLWEGSVLLHVVGAVAPVCPGRENKGCFEDVGWAALPWALLSESALDWAPKSEAPLF